MKNKRMNLVLGLVLLVFAVTLLAGCGGGDKKPEAAPPAKPATQADEPITAIFAKAKQVPGVSYDSVTTMKDMTTTGKVWFEKGKAKMEQTIQGRTMVMYFDGETMYQYDPATNMALKFNVKAMQERAGQKPTDAMDYTEYMNKDSVKVIENVVYDGVKCRVVSYKMKEGDAEVKAWIRDDYGLPMRTEYSGKDGVKVVSEHKNMKIGALPPDTFKLPAGAKIQDMQDFMRNIPTKQQ